MNPIRAFVGHSFLPEDQTVVRAFTDYLDTLAESLPSFMWQDAERAEPNTLTEKVLRIARDKNLFIGICTVRESAIPATSLSVLWPWRSYVKAKADQFALKTSDWVIQEIGMAIGMGMKTILLRETGLRIPGGLQGNTEYIEFDRSSPTEAFPRLLQMISSISPKEATALLTATTENETAEKSDDPSAGTSTLDFGAPDSTWDRLTYQYAALRAAHEKDEITLGRIDAAYRKTPLVSHHDEEKAWEAHVEGLRVRYVFGGDLDRLVTLASENPNNSQVRGSLARAYAFYNEHASAAAEFVAACDTTGDPTEQAELLKRAAEQYILDLDYNKAREVANRIRESIKGVASNELIYLQALDSIARAEKDDRLLVAVLVRIVELKPSSTDARFMLGLKQSELGNDDLSLASYLSVPKAERSSAVWNNLGVEFDKLLLPAKAVEAFGEAADGGETLAMSNLAGKLLDQGFLNEARALCEKAINTGDHPHKNVHDLVSRLAEVPTTEQQSEGVILSAAKSKSDFYRDVGRAIAADDGGKQINQTTWADDVCILAADTEGKGFNLVGSFERQNILLGLLSGVGNPYSSGVAPATPPKRIKHYISYSGRFEGHAFFGTVNRRSEGQSLIADALNETEVIMVLSSDLLALKVVEAPQSKDPKFYALNRRPQ